MADDYDEESEARDVLEVGPGKPLPGPKSAPKTAPKEPPPKTPPPKKRYAKGGKIDGCARRGKTRGQIF